MGGIVVGFDGSEGSQAALRFAAREARLRGAPLRVLTAWHVPALAYAGGVFDPRAYEDDAHAAGEAARAVAAEEGEELEVACAAAQGQAAQVLLDAARDADLLVVGTRGYGGFAGLLLGSVSQELAHHATCPLAIVPSPGEERPRPVA